MDGRSKNDSIELEAGKGDDRSPTKPNIDDEYEAINIPIPGDVRTRRQLQDVPEEYLNHHSDDKHHRPLLHTDARGNTYTYALNPLTYNVFLILVLELLERFSFYGLYLTQTNYLTGSYDARWSANLTSMDAASLISLSTAVAYTVPFLGGMVADAYLGDYRTILAGVTCFYLPGLFLIATSSLPRWLGAEHFNLGAYKLALLLLWPVGTGTVKAVVNIFGARQYHPVLQRSMVESFYVQFYMVINVGAVAGCLMIPIVARASITVAYTIPVVLLSIALLFFVAGSNRYVRVVPGRDGGGGDNINQGGEDDGDDGALVEEANDVPAEEKPNFVDVAKICALIIPFNIVYVQCATTFMVQGAVLEPFLGVIEAPSMDILDSFSVLVFGYFVSGYFYPFFAKRNIKLETGIKFAMGCAIGGCAILWSLILERMIHREYGRTGGRVSVLWQAPSYMLIGCGEIFSISTAYEVAFTASPPNKKAFACAFNLFCIGGLPNMLSLALYGFCQHWFQNDHGSGNISRIEDYSEAHVANYFCVLLGIVMFGVVVNLLPPVRAWIAFVEKRAARAASAGSASTNNTPKFGKKKGGKATKSGSSNETDPLLKAQRHAKYLEEGESAQIYRMNTIKAEFARKDKKEHKK